MAHWCLTQASWPSSFLQCLSIYCPPLPRNAVIAGRQPHPASCGCWGFEHRSFMHWAISPVSDFCCCLSDRKSGGTPSISMSSLFPSLLFCLTKLSSWCSQVSAFSTCACFFTGLVYIKITLHLLFSSFSVYHKACCEFLLFSAFCFFWSIEFQGAHMPYLNSPFFLTKAPSSVSLFVKMLLSACMISWKVNVFLQFPRNRIDGPNSKGLKGILRQLHNWLPWNLFIIPFFWYKSYY